jgi:membrane protease YdiL (CAAX protease family)
MKNKYADLIKSLSDREIMLNSLATQLLLFSISIILGIILFDSFTEFLELFQWNDDMLWKLGLTAGIGVVLLDFVLMRVLPPSYYDDGGLNERLFQHKSIMMIACIAFLAAVSEEILFRGVIQTHFGLVISSLIFALIHYRYLFNWFLFTNVVALSFLIGYIYLVSGNLLVTIFMHFIIDFLLGLIIRFVEGNNTYQAGGDME